MFFFFFFFYFDYFVLFSVFLLLFNFLNNSFWMGFFFVSLDNFFILLSLMSFLLLLMIFLTESSFVMKLMSMFLVFLSFFFFFSLNLLVLYITFELSVFPILLMILGYGSQIEKLNSSYYLLFYTLFCSLPFLFFFFNMISLTSFLNFNFFLSWEMSYILMFLFLVKFPLFFLHLWLPKAHVEAPTSASMMLAGLLLKFGTGGFFRLLFILKFTFDYFLFFVSFVGFFFSCWVSLLQSDLKSLAAYSSINHMMFLLVLLVNLCLYSEFSGVMIMVSHGFISTLMFFFVGEFYHESLTRMLYFFGGYLKSSIYFLVVFSIVWLYNGGIPLSLSFFSEFLGLMSLFIFSVFLFFLLFFYFFLSFYYTMYVLVSGFLKKNIFVVNLWSSFFSIYLLVWGMNFFCFNMLF
uniref:NADH-ubiquinone oxidoreductase chain 4 n=1 Tax=Aphelenchoides besseyi TaxID=269767 RepID=A0A088CQF0_9BILA|nr:NADH dehydrogenase subunit 4 [Aphelenchoides besseyi]AII79385.1 NADH dehydrogenase subunit 4 [Aphelenchoides besseyi]